MFLKYFILLIGLVSLARVFSSPESYWNGKDKLALAVKNSNGGVSLLVFDPELEEIVNIIIPPNLEVEVAHNLGRWKVRSVWELGEYKGIKGGELTVKTITRRLKFPVYLWAEYPALGFTEDNPISLFKAAAFPYKTNLKVKDKIGLALFSLGVKNPKKAEIRLADSAYLESTILIDGEKGYVLRRKFPEELFSYFADPDISKAGLRVGIRDRTGSFGVANEISEVIEVLGGKVVSFVKEDEAEIGCSLKGNDKDMILKFVRLFDCQEDIYTSSNLDIEIILGNKFF